MRIFPSVPRVVKPIILIKAVQPPRPAFLRLVDVLSMLAGRLRFRRLLRDLSGDPRPRPRRAPCIVGIP